MWLFAISITKHIELVCSSPTSSSRQIYFQGWLQVAIGMWSRLKQKVSSITGVYLQKGIKADWIWWVDNRCLFTKVDQSWLDMVSRYSDSPVWSVMRKWYAILVLTGIPGTMSRTHTSHYRIPEQNTGADSLGNTRLRETLAWVHKEVSSQYFAELSNAAHFVSML